MRSACVTSCIYGDWLLSASSGAASLQGRKSRLRLKCVEKIVRIHEAQLLSYLKLTGKRVGLVLNFHVPVLTQGLVRKVL